MKTEVTGILIDGVVQLDQDVPLPNHSRVHVSIEPIDTPADAGGAFEAFKELIQTHPVNSGGSRYTRDELHERR